MDTLIYLATAVILGLVLFAVLLVIFWLKEKRARKALVRANADLEKRLTDRADQLSSANLALQNEVNERRKTVEDLDKRDEAYETIGRNTTLLLSDMDWESHIQPVLEQLGQALALSRVSLLQIKSPDSQPVEFIRLFGWSAPEMSAAGKDGGLFYTPFEDRLAQNEVCAGLTRKLADEEGRLLKANGVLSFLEIPVFCVDQWWGLFHFEDCLTERQWSEAESEMLATLAKILGAILQGKQARQALEASQESYRFLTDNAADLITRHNPNGVCLYASPVSMRLLGYAPEELIGRHFQELVHPDDLPKVLHEFQIAVESPQTSYPGVTLVSLVYRMKAKSGDWVWLETTGRSVRQVDTGETFELIFVTRNINDRVLVEESLRQSEQKFRSIVEQSYDGITLADEQGRVVEWNRAQENITGIAHDEALGKYIWEVEFALLPEALRTPEQYEQIKARFRTPQAGNEGQLFDQQIWRPDGSLHFIQALIYYIHTDKGFMKCLVGRDETGHREIEETLAQERNLLRTLIDNLPDNVYIKDSEGRFVLANQSIARFMGVEKPEDLIGKLDSDFYPREFAVKYLNDELHVTQTGQTLFRVEEIVPDRSGHRRWFSTTKVPLRDSSGNILGVVGVGQDITKRREAEEALRQANEKLTHFVDTLQKSNKEALLLNEVGDLLQSCRVDQDVYAILEKYAEELFPGLCGGMYILRKPQNMLESVVSWGEVIFGDAVFMPEACWGMRRGRVHVVADQTNRLYCQHISDDPDHEFIPYLCQPMNAQGEVLGLLHLQGRQGQAVAEYEGLVRSLAERIALALANLNLRETLHTQAIRDPLTNLFNRRVMEESLDREVHRAIRYRRPLGLIMLDIDNFKAFNDTFSYAAGDTLLRELGAYLQANLRKGDLTCRYGGEEFILILPESTPEDTIKRADQLRDGVKRLRVQHQGLPLGEVTISIGIACFPQHGKSMYEMLRAVDTALHRAKSAGKDCVTIAEEIPGRF
jgi:diguanylate cyclase (GGDEF)-like protein/PAS domain S-box-containing protein